MKKNRSKKSRDTVPLKEKSTKDRKGGRGGGAAAVQDSLLRMPITTFHCTSEDLP
jgi:hypothetical protein